MRSHRKVIILSILTFIFIILSLLVRGSSEGILFDVSILELLHNNDNPIIFNMMKSISFIGSWRFLVPFATIAILYLLNKRRLYESKLLLTNILGSYILNHILKLIIKRTRPFEFFRVEQGGLSFPSGHSMVAASMYLAIAYLLTKDVKNSTKKRFIYGIFISIILLMGISRMYLGVHWPTDIIGGFIMGYIFFNLSIILIK